MLRSRPSAIVSLRARRRISDGNQTAGVTADRRRPARYGNGHGRLRCCRCRGANGERRRKNGPQSDQSTYLSWEPEAGGYRSGAPGGREREDRGREREIQTGESSSAGATDIFIEQIMMLIQTNDHRQSEAVPITSQKHVTNYF